MTAGIHDIKRQYLLLRYAETTLLSVGTGLLALALLFHFLTGWFIALAVTIVSLCTFLLYARHLHLFRLKDTDITSWLNLTYPDLEHSADLLITSNSDSLLLQLQKEIVQKKFEGVPSVHPPHRLLFAVTVLALSTLALWISLGITPSLSEKLPEVEATTPGTVLVSPPALAVAEVVIAPPAYTRKSVSRTTQLKIRAVERSRITWSLQFTSPVQSAWLMFGDGDSLACKPVATRFEATISNPDQGFYAIHWRDKEKTYHSAFFPLEVVDDLAPVIQPLAMPAYTEVSPGSKALVPVRANISDDYAVADARIVATVAKGTGESVKFREEIIRFTSPAAFGHAQQTAERQIDIHKMGLEPGDELYFYIEAADNRSPVANHSRTETFFVTMRDTARFQAVADEGLGVDLMPEYFRSQRQIIIDSEKLLKEKSRIAKQEFNSRSNELGYDQKVLRLRYGQFLGEEFESGIGPATPVVEDEDEEEDPSKKFGHQHDTKNEHNLVQEKSAKAKTTDGHDHHDGDEGKQENPLEGFVHQHDNTEEATFFVQSVKAKLRAALTLMWDAELHLRMYDPARSLPYQYRILKLLKEIANDSRIYVHRTGFDPPPLKEERRLTGDLTELRSGNALTPAPLSIQFPGMRKVLSEMEWWMNSDVEFDTSFREALLQSGQELGTLAAGQPELLPALTSLRRLIDREVTGTERSHDLQEVRRAFWAVLPQESVTPGRQKNIPTRLDAQFQKALRSQP